MKRVSPNRIIGAVGENFKDVLSKPTGSGSNCHVPLGSVSQPLAHSSVWCVPHLHGCFGKGFIALLFPNECDLITTHVGVIEVYPFSILLKLMEHLTDILLG